MQGVNLPTSKNLDKWVEGVSGRIIEPLFIISVLTFILAIIKPFVSGANQIPPIVFTAIFIILGILSSYFVYMYFRKVKNYYLMGVPVLIFTEALFSYHGMNSVGWMAGDFNVFGVVIGIYLLFYVLSVHKFLSKEVAAVIAVVISVFLFHLVPATNPYLTSGDAFDSHWHYKIVNNTYTTEHVMDYDNLTYPKITDPDYYASTPESQWKTSGGLDFSTNFNLHAVFMASTAKILSPLGINQYDTAMLFGGLMAGFAVLFMYLFLREIFYAYAPHNKLVGLIGAFCLGFNYLYSTRSIAGSDEASEMGLMLMAATMYVIFNAIKNKSLKWTLLAGITFFFFSVAWSGYAAYALYALGLFAVLYALAKFLNKENTFSHVPYIVIPMIFPLFNGLILHAHNALPIFSPSKTAMLIISAVIGVPLILEMLRLFLIKSNKITANEEYNEDKRFGKLEMINLFIENALNKLPKNVLGAVSGGIIVIGAIGIFALHDLFLDPVLDALTVTTSGVVFKTIAEQIGQGDFTTYGILFLYGLAMIPLLSYLIAGRQGKPSLHTIIPIGVAVLLHYLVIVMMGSSSLSWIGSTNSWLIFILFVFFDIIAIFLLTLKFSPEGGKMGAAIILILAISGLWAYYNVPQRGVDSVLGIIALGATVGLIAGINKKNLNGLRIIGTIAVIIIPLFVFPFIYNINYTDSTGKVVTLLPYFSHLWHSSTTMLHQGGDGDWNIGSGINWWMHGLQWFNENTAKQDIVLTWWDYGHWITPIAERPVLIDNLQAVHWQLQEVARFFTVYQTEDEAMKLVKEYPNVKYIVIDYTLIGKNHALRFIAQGNLSKQDDKAYEEWLKNPENPNKNALGVCQFGGKSDTIEKSSAGGSEEVSKLYFGYCSYPPNKTQRLDYLAKIEFDIAKRSVDINKPDETQIYVKKIIVQGYTDKETYSAYYGRDVPVPTEEMSLDEWKKNHNGSLLGIQSFGDVIMCVMRDDFSGNFWYCDPRFPMFREFVYAPNEFQNHMFTKLYLGEHANSYAQYGLCDADWCKNPSERLKNWKLVWDNNYGFIRIWKLAMQCDSDNNCDTTSQYCDETKHCVDKKKEKEACTNNTECASGICENNACRKEHLKNNGEQCMISSECLSNNCLNNVCVKTSCLEKYNISEDTIAFLQMDGCGFCTKMKPLVQELENKGYKFLWINTADSEKMNIARECLANIFKFGEGVPQFACPSNGELHPGAFGSWVGTDFVSNVSQMQKFADECRDAAKNK